MIMSYINLTNIKKTSIYLTTYMIEHFIRYFLLKIKWNKKLLFSYSSRISMRSIFEGMNRIYSKSSFDGYMGKGSYIAQNSHISGKIGRYTSIASKCSVIQGVHPYKYPYVSTSPMFFSTFKQNGHTYVNKQIIKEHKYASGNYPIIIGNDCWIGESVSIIAGVTIADGAMVLAGSVVTKDIPPYAIVGGVPAKIIKYRYNNDDIDFLLKSQWWNKEDRWLANNSNLFHDINKFKKVIEKL